MTPINQQPANDPPPQPQAMHPADMKLEIESAWLDDPDNTKEGADEDESSAPQKNRAEP